MRLIRLVRIAAVASLAAPPAARAQLPDRVRVLLPAFSQPVAIDTIMHSYDLKAPAAKVWAAAARVFYDYKMPTDLRDSTRGVVGSTRFVRSGMFVDAMMSRVLNCGMGITGPNADNFRITLALVAVVTPAGSDKAKLGLGFVGSGLDMRGNASDPVACASTGRTEADFADRVKKLLAAP